MKCTESDDHIPNIVKKRRFEKTEAPSEPVCFFCDEKIKDRENCRHVGSVDVDKKVRKAAEILGEGPILGKLLHHDMIAMKATYHPACLTNLYKKAARKEKETEKKFKAVLFKPTVNDCSDQLHYQNETPMNEELTEMDRVTLSKASDILRKHILKIKQSFNGSFSSDAEEASIPSCLTTFITFFPRLHYTTSPVGLHRRSGFMQVPGPLPTTMQMCHQRLEMHASLCMWV